MNELAWIVPASVAFGVLAGSLPSVAREIGRSRHVDTEPPLDVASHVRPVATPTPPRPKEYSAMDLPDIIKDIEHRFADHPSLSQIETDAKTKVEQILQSASKELVTVATDVAPYGREVATAVTKLEEAYFWLNAHIARNQSASPSAPASAEAPDASAVAPAPVAPPPAPESAPQQAPEAPVVEAPSAEPAQPGAVQQAPPGL